MHAECFKKGKPGKKFDSVLSILNWLKRFCFYDLTIWLSSVCIVIIIIIFIYLINIML